MLEILREELRGGDALELSFREDRAPVTFAHALRRLEGEPAFRERVLELFADAPFGAFFWECPPVSADTTARPFRFVLVDAPALAGVRADREPFAAELGEAEAGVACFRNLGGDALLVAPSGDSSPDRYAHLAAFARRAPNEEQHELLRRVALAAEAELGERPLWISTSGLGVAWLHVRLDRRPKYYTHAAYRGWP